MITKFRGTWMSNFWPAPVVLDGERYECVEAAFQASKTLDPGIREQIRRLPSAAAAKQFGKRIGRSIPFRPSWNDDLKLQAMRDLLWQKFTAPDLRQRLIATGDEMLIESGHWHDIFFGVCSCPKCGGRGQNWLGVLLMEIRAECRAQEQSSRLTEDGRLDRAA